MMRRGACVEPETLCISSASCQPTLFFAQCDSACFVADENCKKFVVRGADDCLWQSTFYEQGILPKSEVSNVWIFKDTDCFSPSVEDEKEVVRTLIQVLEKLELVFEHNGLRPSREEYYLVPEVWTRRLRGPDGEKCTDAEADPAAYDARQHVTIGCKTKLEYRLTDRFFPKFVCKCAKVMRDLNNDWANGNITLGSDSLRWESASWPVKPGALVLRLQREVGQVITFKVSGLGGERVREIYGRVGSIVEELLDEARVVKKKQRLLIKPLSTEPAVETKEIDKEAFEEWRSPSGNNPGEFIDRKGVKASTLLYYFGQDRSVISFDPNFEEELLLPKEEAGGPEFLLCQKHAESGCSTESQKKIEKIKSKVLQMRGLRASSQQEDIDRVIQVVNIAKLCGDESVGHSPLCLYFCHPLRNLYLKYDIFDSSVFFDFCEEMMRLFQALRAKQVTTTISSKKELSSTLKARLGSVFGGLEAAGDRKKKGEFQYKSDSGILKPLNPTEETHPVDDQLWFFFDDSKPPPDSNWGFNYDQAKKVVLSMKKQRMNYGSFGSKSLTVSVDDSYNYSLGLKINSILDVGAENAKEKKTSYSLEIQVQGYNWDGDCWV